MAKWSTAEVEKARVHLLELAPKGSRIFGIVRHVAPSGMSRVIDLLVITPDRENSYDGGVKIRTLSWNVARVLGYSYSTKHEGVTVSGCGMDMLFHTVTRLAAELYGDENAFTYRRL